MRILRALPLIPLLLIGIGCTRTSTDTVIANDGSWTRTVKLTIPKEAQMGGDKAPTFEEFFVPPAGAGWKITKTTDKDSQILTAVRSAALGETIMKDIQVKEGGKITCVNQVKVTQIAPGRFEYLETIKYTGDKKPEKAKSVAEVMPIFKAALPAGTDEATINRIGEKFFIEVWHVIFGPSDPMLSMLVLHPDMAERRMKAAFGKAMDRVLAAELGDKMDKEARLKAIRQLVKELDSDKIIGPEKDKQKEESSSGGNSSLVSMFTSVKLPGKIVESNGETDEVSGEVFWGYYADAAVVGDVQLRAVCDVNP